MSERSASDNSLADIIVDLARRVEALERKAGSPLIPNMGNWKDVESFGEDWDNAGGLYQTCQFNRDADGMVHLRGVVTGTFGTTAFTLPEGYRPEVLIYIPTGNTGSSGNLGYLEITDNGDVTPMSTGASTTTFGIDCVFPAAGAAFYPMALATGVTRALSYAAGPGQLYRHRNGMIVARAAIDGEDSTPDEPLFAIGHEFHTDRASVLHCISIEDGYSRVDVRDGLVVLRNGSDQSLSLTGALWPSSLVTGWSDLLPLNGWLPWSTFHPIPEYNDPQSRKDHSGWVQLRGLLHGGTSLSGTVLVTLPEGQRPSARLLRRVASSVGSLPIIIDTDGDISLANGGPAWVSLDGVHFHTT